MNTDLLTPCCAPGARGSGSTVVWETGTDHMDMVRGLPQAPHSDKC